MSTEKTDREESLLDFTLRAQAANIFEAWTGSTMMAAPADLRALGCAGQSGNLR
jgi:hypothetical protein